MTLEIKLIRVLLICFLAGFSTGKTDYSIIDILPYIEHCMFRKAQYSVSVERPCPMETVTFTCTAPGYSLRWVPSDVSRITVRSTSDLNAPHMLSGYTVTLTAFNDTTLTSTLSRTAENRITVYCVDPLPTLTTIGSSMIRLVGELQLVSRLLCVYTKLHRSTRTTIHHQTLHSEQFSKWS